jgi:hypothetical protein
MNKVQGGHIGRSWQPLMTSPPRPTVRSAKSWGAEARWHQNVGEKILEKDGQEMGQPSSTLRTMAASKPLTGRVNALGRISLGVVPGRGAWAWCHR